MHKKIIVIGFLVVILSLILSMAFTPQTQAPQTENQTQAGKQEETSTPNTNPNIILDNLVAQSQITSPLTLTGQAKGWYFEGSFPVKVLNQNSQIIFEGVATAQSDWMTTNFVPFSIVINFPPQTPNSTGQIVFMKDNPSGEAQYDEQFVLPITF